MKKAKSLLAISLTLAIIVGSFVFATGVSATTESAGNNVLAGETPIVYAVFEASTTTNAYQEAYYDSSNYRMCYDAFADNGYARLNIWKPYVAKLTDGDSTTSQIIKPMNSGKDIGIIYEIAETDINSIEIDIASGSTGDVRVYAANSTASLYSTLIDTIPATSTSVTRTVSTTDTRYIAFFFSNPAVVVNEIKVCGDFEDVKSTSPDVLSKEQLPISYVAHSSTSLGTVAYMNIYDQGTNSHPNSGYDKLNSYNYNDDRIAYWQPYTKLLTDNDINTYLRVKPENAVTANMVIVFELADLMKIDGFKIDFYEGHDVVQLGVKKFRVYASDDSATLYNSENMIADVSTYDDEISNETSVNKLAKYIAIQCFENFCIADITINGEELGNNVLKGEMPVVYAATNKDEMTYASREADRNGSWVHGISFFEGKGLDRVSAWEPYLAKLVDEDVNTSFKIKPMSGTANYDDITLVYEIPATDISSFEIDVATGSAAGIKVYAANSKASLYSTLIDTISATSSTVLRTVTTTDTRYIAFVFATADLTVNEIKVYGDFEDVAISTSPDVLSENQIPITYATNKKGAPGTYIYNSLALPSIDGGLRGGYDYFNNVNTDRVSEFQPYTVKLTDNDTSTSYHIQTNDNGVADAVILYELSEVMKLDGFKIEFNNASRKRFKIYASTDYATLYSDANMLSDVDTYKNEVVNEVVINKLAKYVAIQCIEPDFDITEITINGTSQFDVNADNNDDIRDLVALYNAISTGNTTSACDVNCDGLYNAADIAVLREYLLNN